MNVHEAISIGTEMMKHYESTWPGGFHETLLEKSAHNGNHKEIHASRMSNSQDRKKTCKIELNPVKNKQFGFLHCCHPKGKCKNLNCIF